MATGFVPAAGSSGDSRRIDLAHEPGFRIGPLTVEPGLRRVAHVDGREEIVEPRVMQVLVALCRADGAILSRLDLNETCWEGRTVGEDAIGRVLSRLRRLEKSLGAGVFRIVTITKVGYRLCLESETADSHDRGAGQGEPRIDLETSTQGGSVAVLPFTNLTGDAGNDYLADGMAEELIATLSRLPGLKVPSRTSSFSYRARAMDVREIGRQLNVGAVVEGSIREDANRMRLTIQLIDAASGYHLWAGHFDRPRGEIIDLQDDLARAVGHALGRELGVRPSRTSNPEAMRLYLQAISMARQNSADALKGAEALLCRATELDPGFSAARQALAETLLTGINSGALPYQARNEARREAELALALDPQLAGARSVLACLDALQGEWSEAERHFTAALASDDSDPLLREAYARFVLLPTGRHQCAQLQADRALELAPARPQSSYLCGVCAAMRGDLAAMNQHLETALLLGISKQFRPFRILRATCFSFRGRLEEAAEEICAVLPEIALQADGAAIVRQVYRTFGGQSDPRETSAKVKALFNACRDQEEFWNDLHLIALMGCWQVGLGALDEAYAVFGAAVERRRRTRHLTTALLDALWMPIMAGFRADPRFQQLVRDLGMMEHWAAVGPPDGYHLTDGNLLPA